MGLPRTPTSRIAAKFSRRTTAVNSQQRAVKRMGHKTPCVQPRRWGDGRDTPWASILSSLLARPRSRTDVTMWGRSTGPSVHGLFNPSSTSSSTHASADPLHQTASWIVIDSTTPSLIDGCPESVSVRGITVFWRPTKSDGGCRSTAFDFYRDSRGTSLPEAYIGNSTIQP
jgi:hypothetical protein